MAEETKFTPGPWHIVRYGDGDSLVIHYTDEQRICFLATPGGSRRQWEIIQANAGLIAAAPDLYETLRAIAAMRVSREQFVLQGPAFAARCAERMCDLADAALSRVSPSEPETEMKERKG